LNNLNTLYKEKRRKTGTAEPYVCA